MLTSIYSFSLLCLPLITLHVPLMQSPFSLHSFSFYFYIKPRTGLQRKNTQETLPGNLLHLSLLPHITEKPHTKTQTENHTKSPTKTM